VLQYAPPISTDHFDLPHSRAVEMLHDALAAAVARHVPAGVTLALSGGRDSRLLAGLMAQSGRSFDTLTFGEEGDFELRCASGVARALGVPHQRLSIDFDAECVALQTRALHCSTGYSGASYWHSPADLASVSPYLVNGYTMDSVIGGSNMIWPYDRATGKVSFSTHLSRVNSHGVAIPQLAKLLKREAWKGVLDQVTHEIESTYRSYAPSESQRAWGFALHHRQRLNIGNPPWVLSFGAWPILPAVDKQVLKIAGGLPAAVLTERRAQDDVIRSYFPALAELPLDRAGLDMTPLTLRIRQRLARNFLAKIEPITRRLRSNRGPERRYYHRLYDFNGPAWKAARHQAEPSRRKLHELFDEAALSEALPPPDADVEVANSIAGTHGMKMLVGLCLWAERYL
jgi:asparagine synthase (glutamine-hydrolysing)